jgi:hypothetical protein
MRRILAGISACAAALAAVFVTLPSASDVAFAEDVSVAPSLSAPSTKKQVLDFKPTSRLEQVDAEHCERMHDREHRSQSCDDST